MLTWRDEDLQGIMTQESYDDSGGSALGTVRSESTRRTAVRVALAALAAFACLLVLGAGAGATTGPSKQRYVYLIVTDRSIAFHNDNLTQLTRGSYLRFFVFNEGKKPHSLTIMGKRTPLIKPGGRGQTAWILFNRRGRFKFMDPGDVKLFGYVAIL